MQTDGQNSRLPAYNETPECSFSVEVTQQALWVYKTNLTTRRKHTYHSKQINYVPMPLQKNLWQFRGHSEISIKFLM